MRDYLQWHRQYEDPDSGLPWRLEKVRGYLHSELDRRPGPLGVVSVCAGDGRDVLGVLDARTDADRVRATLLELHPDLAAVAREHARRLSSEVVVREVDAGHTDAYVRAVPADVLIMVGVLGNVTDADLEQTVAAVPQLCASDALVVWSRGLVDRPDNDGIRAQLAAVGCVELDYAEHAIPDGGRTTVGAARFIGTPAALRAGERLFTFVR